MPRAHHPIRELQSSILRRVLVRQDSPELGAGIDQRLHQPNQS